MAQGQELERLFITLLADDSKLDASMKRALATARRVAEEISRAFERGAAKGFEDTGVRVERSARRQTAALDPVKKALEAVKNETASLRNTTEAGTTTNEQAIARFKELRDEALRQAQAFGVTSKEYRGYTQAAAQASRSVATLEGRVTKLGFSANNAVGVSEALRQNIGLLGPGAASAARGLGLVQTALSNFAPTSASAGGAIDGLLRGFQRLNALLPLIAVAAGGAAIAALVRFGNAAAEVADGIDKGARSAGLSAEAYQELRFAFDQNGVSAERFDTLMQGLNQRLGQAAQGSKAQGEAFARLGVEIRDASGNIRGTEEVLRDVIQGLSDLPSAAERAAAGMEVLGRTGRELGALLDTGVEGIDALRDSAREMGLVVSGSAIISLVEYKDTMATLQRQFETARIEIVAGFIPVLSDLLIPLLQNTIVPLLQRAAESVKAFTDQLRDTGPAGQAFRTELANQIAPIAVFAAQMQIAHNSLRILAINFDLSAQRARAFILGIGQTIDSAPDSVRSFLGLAPRAAPPSGGRDTSSQNLLADTERVIAELEAKLEEVQSSLTDAFVTLQDPAAAVRGIIEGLADSVREGATAFRGLGEGAEDAAQKIATVASAPIGSLAAFREAAAAARRDFERAITDEARAAALEREEIALAEAQNIINAFTAPDILNAARAWTGRLEAELRQGVKNVPEVTTLLADGIARVKELADAAFDEFGWDSQEYREQIARLEFLEAFLDRVSRPRDIRVTPVIDLSGFAIPIPEASIALLDRPLREVAFALAQLRAEAREGMPEIANSFETLTRSIALGAATQRSALNASTEAIRIFADTVTAVLTSAGRENPFPEGFADFFALPDLPTIELADRSAISVLRRALDEQEAAFRAAQEAMTEAQLEQANVRLSAATEEVRRLRELGLEAPEVEVDASARVREDLTARLAAAAAAAEVFGTQSELAAVKTNLLEGAIQSLLLLDPSADIADLVLLWELYSAGVEDAVISTRDLSTEYASLGAALEQLDRLSGTAPDQFEQLAIAFRNAERAGIITKEALDELLETIGRLKEVDEASQALRDLAGAFDIGSQIMDGLTNALEGIKAGDLQGVLSGLTSVGVAIGTAIGSPAAGALVGAIGGAIQSAVGLFQSISDLFTGDSKARRDLARALTATVSSAFRAGILDGMKGSDDWQARLGENVKEAVLGALIDAFVQAAIVNAMFAPFIDEFTKTLNRLGPDAAWDYFDREFPNILDRALEAATELVERGRRLFPQGGTTGTDPLNPTGTIELPNATVTVLAAPQWALELNTSAERMSQAGAAMLEAANLMKSTFQGGITVNTQSGRGIDAQRAAA